RRARHLLPAQGGRHHPRGTAARAVPRGRGRRAPDERGPAGRAHRRPEHNPADGGLMDRWGLSMGVSPREPLSNVKRLAAAAEERGFEALWYIDFQLGMKDVYAAMYLAAEATENLHIGSAVTNLVTRHPTVTAN